jgi:hypothetical protein
MRIDGVTTTVLETWVRRDYGLSSAELRTAIELRDGKCPPYLGGVRGITPRDVYLARNIRLLPEMAKPRCRARAEKYTAQLVQLLFPKMKLPEFR